MKKIITISREFGAGGGQIGKAVAERLGYYYLDKHSGSETYDLQCKNFGNNGNSRKQRGSGVLYFQWIARF